MFWIHLVGNIVCLVESLVVGFWLGMLPGRLIRKKSKKQVKLGVAFREIFVEDIKRFILFIYPR